MPVWITADDASCGEVMAHFKSSDFAKGWNFGKA